MSRATAADPVAAVSQAGGLGTLGISSMTPEEIRTSCERIRSLTTAPFGLNALLFLVTAEQLDAVLGCRPRVHDTLISEIPEIVNGQVWPGAYARVRRNAFMKEWIGREGELRRRWREVLPQVQAARAAGDADRGTLLMGEDAGLIDAIEPAGALVTRLASDAEAALRECERLLVTDEQREDRQAGSRR